jgi:hypothetical protein
MASVGGDVLMARGAPGAGERQWLDQHGCASTCFFMLHQMRVILICIDVNAPQSAGVQAKKSRL